MKKIIQLTLFLLTIVAGTFTACHEESNVITGGNSEIHALAPAEAITVENNTLVFKDLNAFEQTLKFIEGSSEADILKWQESINFYSARRYYEMASSEMCCPDEKSDLTMIKNQYKDKLLFDSEDNSFRPLVRNSIMNWVTNEKGGYKIGAGYFLVKDGVLYSINDKNNTISKLDQVIPQQFAADILDQHPVGIQVESADHQSVEERGCDRSGTNFGATLNSSIEQCGSVGCHRTKEAWNAVEDWSTILPGLNGGSLPNVRFIRGCHAKHQRKTIFGWTVCERTVWTWTASHALTHNIPSTFPPSISIMNSTLSSVSGEECDWNHDMVILSVDLLGPSGPALSAYNGRYVTGSLSFSYTANDCGVVSAFICP